MQAAAMLTTQREDNGHARARALVRFNGSTFRSLAAASILETAAPLHVGRVARVFADDPDVGLWLEQVWWPRRAELGRQLREYVEATWPEFDWNAAYADFCESYRPRSGLEGSKAAGAREALGLCVMEAQAALFYRALAASADELQLRALAREGAGEHALFFDFFRTLFERRKRTERVGFGAAWRTAIAACRSARDHDVAAAFEVLDRHWSSAPIVPALGYAVYRHRVVQLIRRHVEMGPVERLLFRPWLARERAATAPGQRANPPRGWLALRPATA